MQPLSSGAAWAVAVLQLSGLTLNADDLTAWEADVQPLSLDERSHRFDPAPAAGPSPPGSQPVAASANQLGCGVELNHWRLCFAQGTSTASSLTLDADKVFARHAYVSVRRAQLLLDWHRMLIPALDTLQSAHSLTFNGCPWRGALAPEAPASASRNRSGESPRVHSAMDKVATFMLEVFSNAYGAWAQAEAIAWYHAELLRLRPFVEGNHLLALLVAGTQMEILFGRLPSHAVDGAAYQEAMQLVTRRVTLVPLTRWFHRLVAGREPFPYARNPRLNPWRHQRRRPMR